MATFNVTWRGLGGGEAEGGSLYFLCIIKCELFKKVLKRDREIEKEQERVEELRQFTKISYFF